MLRPGNRPVHSAKAPHSRCSGVRHTRTVRGGGEVAVALDVLRVSFDCDESVAMFRGNVEGKVDGTATATALPSLIAQGA